MYIPKRVEILWVLAVVAGCGEPGTGSSSHDTNAGPDGREEATAEDSATRQTRFTNLGAPALVGRVVGAGGGAPPTAVSAAPPITTDRRNRELISTSVTRGDVGGSSPELRDLCAPRDSNRMPGDVATAEWKRIKDAGVDKVHFAYCIEESKPGKPMTYRIQGPTFVVEFINTQADSARNPANHIHSGWRRLPKDFETK